MTTHSARRLIAVVVTFNRLPLLRRLLSVLAGTAHLTDVVVVNNASTDGTTEWLAHQSAQQSGSVRLKVANLPENLGGAGGFKHGLEIAMAEGGDLFWLMDDDGVPTSDCLAHLLKYEGKFDFYGPVVVAEGNAQQLCFPIRLPGTATVVHQMSDVCAAATDGLIPDIVIPFNGVLLTRQLVQKIGYPRAEFFIWGDDFEYLWRARQAGARVATVVDSVFEHPATDDLGTPMAFGKAKYNHSPSDLKHYCMARNNTLNLLCYRSPAHAAAFVAKTAWFYTATRPSWSRLKLSAKAIGAAMRKDFSGHQQFLAQPSRTKELSARTAQDPQLTPGETLQAATLDLDDVTVHYRGGPRHAPTQPANAQQLPEHDSVAIVIVTFNRAELLGKMLDGIAALTHQPDAVYVVNNNSTDGTKELLEQRADLPLVVVESPRNVGGAGGFHLGTRLAHAAGYDRLWLMDDDVTPEPDCLLELMRRPELCLIAVREDKDGQLMETSATRFDLKNPFLVRPKRRAVNTDYRTRADMPPLVEVEVVAFEGFMVHRSVIDRIGFPDASFFIFYDDADFVLRARDAGYRAVAVRDAVLVRQLPFDQKFDLASWKGRFMFRNLFVVHFRHGQNHAVRWKPYVITAGVVAVNLLKRGPKAERVNAIRGLKEAIDMELLRNIPRQKQRRAPAQVRRQADVSKADISR